MCMAQAAISTEEAYAQSFDQLGTHGALPIPLRLS